MFKRFLIAGWLGLLSTSLISGQSASDGRPARERDVVFSDASTSRALLDQYCVSCHNQRLKTANLLLDQLDLSHLPDHAEVAEQVVRKLRAGMMPPPGVRRPQPAELEALIAWLEVQLDRSAAPNLTPPGVHRLNRIEYQNAIRDLLGLHVNASAFLPSDNSTYGFDNIAGALTMSPALVEAYLSAAGRISRLAMSKAIPPTEVVYKAPEDATQDYHIEGLPFATRGGLLVRHEFPADGAYTFKVTPVGQGFNNQNNFTFGRVKGEQLVLLVDGERVSVLDWDKEMQGFAVRSGVESPRIPIKAGHHTIGVTFLATNYAPSNDLNEPFARSTIETGGIAGFTFYPHVGLVRIHGPFNATNAADSASRRRIFVCQPKSRREEEPCARTILSTLARRAFRRPVTPADVAPLMEFYQSGRTGQGTFADGIEKALRRLLVEPEFLYRGEQAPAGVAAGQKYRISSLELASRLSFFLWSSIPDDELLNLAARERLRDPAVLEQQVRRMLADPKSAALVENFTGQWLNLRALATVSPSAQVFPDFDDNLRQAFRREVELLFATVVQEDRSVLDLLNADYTFVDERLAKHYGLPNVYGSQFRRVTLGSAFDARRGLLGKGALHAVTSQATRTSPVTRGKWFLQTFLGVSPPQPPPNVDTTLKERPADNTGNTKAPTMRQVLEMHRANPACATCHKIFEPIGLALENFDAIGAWRTTDEGAPINPSGVITDGTQIDGVASLRGVLSHYSHQVVQVIAEKLLTYALGRGIDHRDMPLVREIARNAAADEHRFSSFVLGVVKSVPFQYNSNGEPLAARAAGQ